jgi:hypothetical protein
MLITSEGGQIASGDIIRVGKRRWVKIVNADKESRGTG